MPETIISASKEEHKYYPYSGIFFVTRRSFWLAGQDSFTQPPAQNPDMFSKLTNVEPVLQGVLRRRRGYTLFSNQAPAVPYSLGYSFRNDLLQLRRVVWTSPSSVLATDEQGANVASPLFTPSAGAVAPRMVLSRNFGYFADGVVADNKKWDGVGLSNWGLDVNAATATVGPNSPTTASSSGSPAWSNPTNVFTLNGAVASATTPAVTTATSGNLLSQGYGFSGLAGATVTGILVEAYVTTISYTGNENARITLASQLLKAGTPAGTSLAASRLSPGAINAYVPIGGPGNLWGVSWLPGDIQASTFGQQLSFSATQTASFGHTTQGTITVNVDHIRITVFLKAPPLLEATGGAGNVTLLSGRTYFYVFQNSKTGATSSLSPPSTSTGPVTSSQISLTSIPASPDAQADTTLILATADGNDQTTLFLVTSLANGTSTYTDNASDTVLLTQPLYQNTDSFGQLHGVANNNPPPSLFFPIKHKGRIYGANGSTLYFSKNLDEVTTALGLTTSKWEEAWPAVNSLDISETAETIKGILSDGETLWIGTERSIRRLIGDSPQNFQKPEVQFNETGIFNQDVWKIVFYEGQPVGTMWLTPDLRIISSDFNTYQDVGWPIQDVLNSVNVGATFGPQASFVSKGSSDYFMLYLPTGANTAPDTICVYNLRTQKWFIWQPTDTAIGSLFFIDATGLPRWLFSAQAGQIFEWLEGSNTDRIGVLSTPYPITIQTSWLDFGDSNLRKALNQILYLGLTNPTITIEGAITDFHLDTAPQVVLPATSTSVGPLQDLFVPLAGTASQHRWYRLTFVAQSFEAVDVLDGFSIEAVGLLRY